MFGTMAVNKYFNVKQGLTTGNITLDASTSNISAANVNLTGTISAVDLFLSGNVTANLTPNANVTLSLGNAARRFANLHVANINIGSQTITANATTVAFSDGIAANNISIGNALIATDVSANTANIKVIVSTDTITGNLLIANIGNFTTQLKANTFTANNANINVVAVNNQLLINSTTNSTSTTTGSFVTAGGVGIQQDLYVGGAIHLANSAGGATSKGYINYNDAASGIDFNFNG